MRQKAGDEAALEITQEFGAYLGQALVNLAATVDPAVFVIGGGVSKAGNILLDIVRKYFYDHAFYGNRKLRFYLQHLETMLEFTEQQNRCFKF